MIVECWVKRAFFWC